ncbi:MAG: 50S ribosomal protein L9 [Rhodospirillaceae bacterium]|nr:50S ribosomal protein L9 [Rhodospirillaceae bacterium]
MDVILLERIDKLGQMGDVVKVKTGYARNFLLPQKKALRATDANRTYFESRRSELEAVNLERRGEAEAVAKKMEGLRLVLVRQAGEGGQLYGSVTARDVADGLKADGVKMDRGQVELHAAIKQLGKYDVAVKLHPEVSVDISLTVSRSMDQADIDAAGSLLEREEDAAEAIVQEQEAEQARDEKLDTQAADEAKAAAAEAAKAAVPAIEVTEDAGNAEEGA